MAVNHLLASIAFGTLINLIFRWLAIFKVNKWHAILTNYVTCFILGFIMHPIYDPMYFIGSEWAGWALLLGVVFVTIFYAMAQTTAKLGVSVNAVSSKMSVVGPVAFSVFYLSQSMHPVFYLGLALSLISIYFISARKGMLIPRKFYFLPVVVFLGSAAIDTSLKVMQHNFARQVPFEVMTYTIFLGAFIAGVIIYLISHRFTLRLSFKDVVGGVVLGVPNFFSIYFLLLAIHGFDLKSAFVFGINNISIVLMSTLLSMLFFKEKLSNYNRIGVILAIISIAIIAYVS